MGNNLSSTGPSSPEGTTQTEKFIFNPDKPLGSEDAVVIFKSYCTEDSEDRLDRENAKRFLQDLAEAIEIEYNAEQADQLFDACTSPDDRFLSFPGFKKMVWMAHEAIEKTEPAATTTTTTTTKASGSPKPLAKDHPEKKHVGKYARATSPFRGRGERERGHERGQHRNAGKDSKTGSGTRWSAGTQDGKEKKQQRPRFHISPSMLGDPFEKTKTFGVSLEVAASKNKQNRLVPLPLVQAFHYIETAKMGIYPAIEEEGLYRVPGSHQAFVQYRLDYDMGIEVDFSKEQNVENVALVVIKYFKELPKSLLFPLDREFAACQKAAGGDPFELIRTLPQLLESLGDSSVETLRALVKHLQEVVKHSEKNKMTLANVERTFAICLGPTFGWLVGVLVENDLLPEERVYKGEEEEEENDERKEQKEEDLEEPQQKEEEEKETKPSGWAPISPSPSGKSHVPRSASPPLLGGGIGREADSNPDQPISPPHSPSHFPLQSLPSSLSQETLTGQGGQGSPPIEENEEKDKESKSNLRKSGSGIFRRSKHYPNSKADEGHEKKSRAKIAFLGKKTRSGLDPGASRNRKHDSVSLQNQDNAAPELERNTSAWIVNQPLKPPIMKSSFPHSGELRASNSSRLWYSMYTAGKYVLEIDAPESIFEFAFIEVTVDVVDVEWENLHAERLTSSSPRLRLEFRVQPLEEGEEEEYHGLVIEATLKPRSEESSLPEKISCKGVVSIYPAEGLKDFTTLPFLYDDDFSVAFPVKNNMKIDDITHALTEEKNKIAQLLPLRYGGQKTKDKDDED